MNTQLNRLNLVAPVNSLGFGLVGLNLLAALDSLGVEVAWWPLGQPESPRQHMGLLQRTHSRTATFDGTAPSVRLWHQHDMALFPGRGLRIGFPIFELDDFNSVERHHLGQCDALLVCSDWAREVIARHFPRMRVGVVPLGVDTALFEPGSQQEARMRLGQLFLSFVIPESSTVFLHAGKWEVRKGVDLVIQAFHQAFSPADDVRLILHTHNPFLSPAQHQEWVNFARSGPMSEKVLLTPERFAHQEMVVALMQAADVGVFPARAEGWNCELAEMLAMGKVCIATNYSAHTQYASRAGALLLEPEGLESAQDGIWFHGQGRWARLGQHLLEDMVDYMRLAHATRKSGPLENRGARDVFCSQFTWQQSVQRLLEEVSSWL